MCTSMFITTLFIIAKTWKQPKCTLTDELTKKMQSVLCVCVCLYIYIMPFAASWMNPEITILSEVSQKDKDKYHMISLNCGI